MTSWLRAQIGKRWKFALVAVILTALYFGYRSFEETRRFYYEFGVDVTYANQQISIARTVACIPPRFAADRTPTSGRSQTAIAEKLGDGSGLIVIIPALCESEAWPLPPRFVPQILWTENADHPEYFEAYLSEDVVRSGKARIKLEKVHASVSSARRLAENRPDFATISTSPFDDRFRSNDTPGIELEALIARAVTFDEWKDVPEIADYLSTVTMSGSLPPNRQIPFDLYFPTDTNWVDIVGGAAQLTARESHKVALDEVFPLRWVEGMFQPDWALKGIALMYPVDKIPTLNMQVSDARSPGVRMIIPRGAQTDFAYPRWPLIVGMTRCEAAGATQCYDLPSRQVLEIERLPLVIFLKQS